MTELATDLAIYLTFESHRLPGDQILSTPIKISDVKRMNLSIDISRVPKEFLPKKKKKSYAKGKG